MRITGTAVLSFSIVIITASISACGSPRQVGEGGASAGPSKQSASLSPAEEAARAVESAAQAATEKAAEEKAAAEAAALASGQAGGDAGAAGSAPMTEAEKAAEAKKAEERRVAALDVPAPILSGPAQGVYGGGVTVSAAVSLKEARLVYTTDGTDPGPKNGKSYTGPITIATSAVLKVVAFVPGGKTSRTATREFTIGEVCAAPGGSGDGRRGSPIGDIAAAIEKARSLDIALVKLSADSAFSVSLDLNAPITLSGGWKTGFSSKSGGYTVIQGRDFDGTSKKAPGYALRVSGAKADASLKFERIEFRGGAASYTAGIVAVDGATPTFVDCRSFGGDGSYGYGAAVIGNAAPTFRYCRLSGGDGATSYGLSVDSARATVASSVLLAGKGSVGGYGLSATDGRVRVTSSVLAGSAANVSYGAAFYNCKDSRLESCTVVGGSGKEAAGVFLSASDPAIENCIISANGATKSFGIVDNYGDSAPSRLNAVAFLGCAGGLYYDADTKLAYKTVDSTGGLLADGKLLGKPKASACAIATFTLSPDDDFSTPSSAAMPMGKVLSGDAALDIRGKPRTEPWTIGAYQ